MIECKGMLKRHYARKVCHYGAEMGPSVGGSRAVTPSREKSVVTSIF